MKLNLNRKRGFLIAFLFFGGIFSLSAYAHGPLIATIDVDGDGKGDKIYNDQSYVGIDRASGVSTSYYIGASWSLLFGNSSSIVDLDGESGAEIPLTADGTLKIINDKKKTVRSVAISSSSWTTLPGGITDMDGKAGAEIAINAVGELMIYNYAKNSQSKYTISSKSWTVVPGGIADLDGAAGADIALNIVGAVEIIHPASNARKSYSINSNSWAALPNGVQDMDGQVGAELAINYGSGIKVIVDKSKSYSDYPINSSVWSVPGNGVVNMDDKSGAEICVKNGGDLTIIRQFDKTVQNAAVIPGASNPTNWAILDKGLADFDGKSGADIPVNIGNNTIKIYHPLGRSWSSYNLGSSWYVYGYANMDGSPGLEIDLQVGNSRKTLNDRTGRVY